MSWKLERFTDPVTAAGLLTLDNGVRINGVRGVHQPSGRISISFTIPDETISGHGCRIVFTAEGRVVIDLRAILFLWEGNSASLDIDDFYLQPVPPPVIIVEPCPDPEPEPDPITDPFGIIQDTYASGDWDLSTKEGCGKFTEECCKRLHNINSNKWGYIRISGAQNGYNGHRLDKVQLLTRSGDTQAGVYDIIFDSESPTAEPSFNFQGDPLESLWYYPAAGQNG